MRRISLPCILSLALLSPVPLCAQEEASDPALENAGEPTVGGAPANQEGEGQAGQNPQAESTEESTEENTEEADQGVADAPADEQGSRSPNEDFIPSIQISEDLSVAFPVDI